jgi:hypothetical protein
LGEEGGHQLEGRWWRTADGGGVEGYAGGGTRQWGITVVSDGGLVSVAASPSNIELGFTAVEEVGEATVRSAESGGAVRRRRGHRRRVGDGRGRREQSHWKRHMQSGGRRGDTRGVEIDKEEDSQKSRSPVTRWVGR